MRLSRGPWGVKSPGPPRPKGRIVSSLPRLHFDGAQRAPLRAATWAALQSSAQIPGNASSVHQAGQDARRQVEGAAQGVRQWLKLAHRAPILWAGSPWEARLLLLLGLSPKPAPAQAGRHVLWLGDGARAEPYQEAATAAGLVLTVLSLAEARAGAPPCAADGSPWARIIVEAASSGSGHLMPLGPGGPLQAALKGAPWALVLGPAAPLWPALAGHSLAPQALVLDGAPVGGPEGMAAVALAAEVTVAPLWPGGGQQEGLRPGTVPKDGAVALAAALAHGPSPRALQQLAGPRDALQEGLVAAGAAPICGQDLERLPHVTLVHLPGEDVRTLQQRLWRQRLAVGVAPCSCCGQEGLRLGLRPEHTPAQLERLRRALATLCKGPKTCAKGRA